MLTQTIDIEGAKIAFWRTDESADELYTMSVVFLLDAELAVYQSFKNDRRRREWLATRILVKEMLGNYPGIDYDADGAPRLIGYDNINISVSHTEGMVAVAMSVKFRVGIDIERVTNRVLRIKDKFLHSDEYDVNDPNLLQLLYIQWCAKEPMYKAFNVKHYDYQNTYTLPEFHFDGNMQGTTTGKVITDDGNVKDLMVNYFEIEGCMVCIAK